MTHDDGHQGKDDKPSLLPDCHTAAMILASDDMDKMGVEENLRAEGKVDTGESDSHVTQQLDRLVSMLKAT